MKSEKVVLSRSMKGKKLPKTLIVSDNFAEEVNRLKSAVGEEIIIFGSPSATNTLTQENLVDEFWIFINPILLGQGIPLFKDLQQKTKLKLIKSHAFSCGVVCLHYEKI